mmetsp:Transcript_93428/g.204492  ORF Transcript_93428/g.204492 Transcript_93428/m.204492 type:complete len:507 (-) Transcript_93428:94-1614(-)
MISSTEVQQEIEQPLLARTSSNPIHTQSAKLFDSHVASQVALIEASMPSVPQAVSISPASCGRSTSSSCRNIVIHTPATLPTCTFNLVLSSVGVGALTLPYSIASIGWVQAGVLLIGCYFLSIYNLYLLDRVCRQLDDSSASATYAAVISSILGVKGAYLLEASMLLYSFGLTVSYFGVIGVELGTVFESRLLGWDCPSNSFMVLAATFIVLPLSLLPEKILQYAGSIGTLCMAFTTFVVVVEAPWSFSGTKLFDACGLSDKVDQPDMWVTGASSLLAAIPIFTFCMNAATAFVSIRHRMTPLSPTSDDLETSLTAASPQDSTPGESLQPQWSKVGSMIWIGQTVALLDYVLAGAAGYFSFCSDVPDNVLDGYASSRRLAVAARLALALQLVLACAGVYIPLARAALASLTSGLESPPVRGGRRVVSSGVIVGLAVVVALALNGALQLPLGLTSSVCTTAMMFIFPGIAAATLAKTRGAKVLPNLFSLLGLAIGIASTTSLLASPP